MGRSGAAGAGQHRAGGVGAGDGRVSVSGDGHGGGVGVAAVVPADRVAVGVGLGHRDLSILGDTIDGDGQMFVENVSKASAKAFDLIDKIMKAL